MAARLDRDEALNADVTGSTSGRHQAACNTSHPFLRILTIKSPSAPRSDRDSAREECTFLLDLGPWPLNGSQVLPFAFHMHFLVVQLSADQIGSRVPAVPGRPPRRSHTGAGTVCWEAYRLSRRVPLLLANNHNQTVNLLHSLGIPSGWGLTPPLQD